jgi:hypothetical protein
MYVRTVFGIATILTLLASTALAAPPATSIAEADADFVVQGEFVGSISTDGPVGLQVVALGGGKFDAVLYRGGLPGAGWDRKGKAKFHGERQPEGIVLASELHSLHLAGSRATLTVTGGNSLGNLSRIERKSPTLGLAPPASAKVLFDGAPHDLKDAKVSQDNLLERGAVTAMPVGDFRLHLEFKTPYQPEAREQGRGNSGVYIQRRYEVQILDSFGLEGAFNECGALYRQTPPDVNMALPPLAWQTYDIWFTPAKFDDAKKKIANARITVWHNGVAVHDNREITAKTGGGSPEGPQSLPILFQDHRDPVQFRNLWIVMEAVPHPAESNVESAAPATEIIWSECVQCVCQCRRGLIGRWNR